MFQPFQCFSRCSVSAVAVFQLFQCFIVSVFQPLRCFSHCAVVFHCFQCFSYCGVSAVAVFQLFQCFSVLAVIVFQLFQCFSRCSVSAVATWLEMYGHRINLSVYHLIILQLQQYIEDVGQWDTRVVYSLLVREVTFVPS